MKGLRILIFIISAWMTLPGRFIHAQGENNNWTFGNGAGLDFNSGNPVFFKCSMYAQEGSASISDAFGNLIFYTSGSTVWDKNGNPMPHGNIVGNGYDGSGTQAVLILKSLSNPDEYYLFTLDPCEVGRYANPKLRYSIVNMALNNGWGDVRSDARDIVLDDEMEESMFAVESDDCGYWIVGHKRYTNVYVSIQLTSSGIMPPVYSTGTYSGYYHGGDPGEMKISPDKSKIARMFFNSSVIEIGDFNSATGTITNTAVLDSNMLGGQYSTYGYGLSFSPNNSKLYATINRGADLYQYDLSAYPNIQMIRNNKVLIENSLSPYALRGMRIGFSNDIYIVNSSEGFISVINDPEQLGLGCNFVSKAVSIPSSGAFPGFPSFYGNSFGNPTVTVTYKDTLPGKYIDTLICFSDSARLGVEDNLLGYTWNDGTTGASRYVRQDGIYYCLSTKECTLRRDTFKVTFVKGNPPDLGADTVICPGDSLVLSISGDGFQWQDGSTEPEYRVTQPGWYSVTINENVCYYSDSIQVAIYAPKAEILENDTLICKGAKIFLHGLSEPAGNLRWNTGSEETRLQITESGLYVLEATNLCGVFYDSVTVQVQDCDCQPGIPNAFSPNNDGVNDVFKVILNCSSKSFGLSVYNRFGQRVYSSYSQEEGWDGVYKRKSADLGIYFYELKYETPNGILVRKKGDVVLVR